MNYTQMIMAIENHINNADGGDSYSDWYVGITDNPERRFQEHGVTGINHGVGFPAVNNSIAREVENYFLKSRGCQGAGGGGDEDSVYVYAYKIGLNTKQ